MPIYNNSLLYHGLPASAVSRLQSVQNHAARLLTRTGYRNHIVPVLRDLHWLPVTERIKYKILVIVYKCLNCKKYPSYLSDLLKLYKPNRELRSSSDTTLLVEPRSSKKIGDCAFSRGGPRLWNSLPRKLRESS